MRQVIETRSESHGCVDEIVRTGSDQHDVTQVRQHLCYFLGQSKHGVVISLRKYAMEILEGTRLMNAKPIDTLMD